MKHERISRGWTQADLAGFLETDGYTVNRWERGRAQPSLHFRRKLCELFSKSASELGLAPQEPSASSLPLPPWSVPARRNPLFTGRSSLLACLHDHLCPADAEAGPRACALQGLGGMGKTQTALEYAYRYAHHYSAIFWIEAETTESISASFVRIADRLELPQVPQADHAQIFAAVERWLSQHHGWLLIWDNVEDLDLLQRWLPSTRQGALLFTTRRQALGPLAVGIELSPMIGDEGPLFVLRRAKLLPLSASGEQMQHLFEQTPAMAETVQQVVSALGGLPLALDQAGAYLEETGCSLQCYLALYQARRGELLTRRGEAAFDHPASVLTTWSLAFEQLERANRAAANLLRLTTFLHPDAIPEEFFRENTALLSEESGVIDALQLQEAFKTACAFSLLKRQGQDRTFSIHRLVQAVLWERMGEQERQTWQWRALRALNAAFPEIMPQTWQQCERYLPHLLACAAGFAEEVLDADLAAVLCKAADYLRGRARFAQAEPLYQRAIRIETQLVGTHHARIAPPLYGLALLYYEQGKYAQAEPLGRQALAIWQQALAAHDPELARPLVGLGLICFSRANYAQAEQLFHQALSLREEAFGSEHPHLIAPLTDLADVYQEQGKYAQAEALYQRAIALQECTLGEEHPLLAYPLSGLGRLSLKQGKYVQAEVLCRRALHVREMTLGAEHPYVAEPLTSLAIIALRQGQEEQAASLAQRALHLAEHALGEQHPDVAAPLLPLADLYARQGKAAQARVLYRRALAIREQALGPEHPLVAMVLTALASLPSSPVTPF